MVKSSIFSTNSEAAERLNDIIEQSFDGIFITDGNATVIKINHANKKASIDYQFSYF